MQGKLLPRESSLSFPRFWNSTLGLSRLTCFVISYPQRMHTVGFSLREKKVGSEMRNWGQNFRVGTGSD